MLRGSGPQLADLFNLMSYARTGLDVIPDNDHPDGRQIRRCYFSKNDVVSLFIEDLFEDS